MNEIAIYEPPDADRGDLLFDPGAHAHAWQVAQRLSSAELLPPHMRGKTADILVALAMARRLKEDPLIVLQSIYFIQGRAGWAAQYLIARANNSARVEGGIRWTEKGKPGAEDYEVTASVKLLPDRSVESFTVTWQMAKAEGWVGRNAKYRTMPSLMLRYRSATLLIRLHLPEVLLGLPTSDELEDIPARPTPEPRPAPLPEPEPVVWQPAVAHVTVAHVPSEPAATPPPSDGAVPAAGGEQGAEGGGLPEAPTEQEDRKLPKQNAVLEAEMIEKRLLTQPRGKPIAFELAKGALKEALGVGRLGDERVLSALRFGVTRRMWELVGEGKDTRIILPGGKATEPPPTMAEALTPDPDPFAEFTDREVVDLISDEEHILDERGILIGRMVRLGEDAGLVHNDAGVITDGAPRPALVRYLRALRDLRQKTNAAANGGM